MSCGHTRWPDMGSLHRQTLAKSWPSPIAKAENDSALYEWLLKIADAAIPKVREAFIRAVAMVRGSAREAALRAALESGSVERVLAVLDIEGQMAGAMSTEIIPPLEDVFVAAGRAAPAATIPSQLRAAVAYRFDIANPATTQFLRTYNLGLIQSVTTETREAIRAVVTDAFRFGGHPYEQARLIRPLIGLTRRGVIAAQNYEATLREEARPADQIERMAARYRNRLLNVRAKTIARTSTIDAANAGTQAAWSGAADAGLLNRSTLRQAWGVTPDDRLCPTCAAIPGMNEGGVPLGGYFQSPVGPLKGPTAHPQCRCYVYLKAF